MMLAHQDDDWKGHPAQVPPAWEGLEPSPEDAPPWYSPCEFALPAGLLGSSGAFGDDEAEWPTAEVDGEVARIVFPRPPPATQEEPNAVGDAASWGSGSFPNPWLWPTDVTLLAGGSGLPTPVLLPPSSQAADEADALERHAAIPHAPDEPMKIPVPGQRDFCACRWHKSAETVGVISSNGHVFTKTAGPRRSRVSEHGARVELASICMVFDASLRCGGVHRYCYQIMEGELGAADGAGFVFDSKVRRNNIQRMRSVFLNQRGRICLRNNQQVTKLRAQLPPLTVGVCLTLHIDLDALMARFDVYSEQGLLFGSADVGLDGLFDLGAGSGQQLRSGFFCAVVTGNITIGIS